MKKIIVFILKLIISPVVAFICAVIGFLLLPVLGIVLLFNDGLRNQIITGHRVIKENG